MPRLTTTQRGLGWEHQQERARLLTSALGRFCPYWRVDPKCPGLMKAGQPLDLDHVVPRALGGHRGPRRISHAGCNRRAGARLKHRLRRGRQAAAQASTSRAW